MKINKRFLFNLVVGLSLLTGLSGCYDPMKPNQPNGRRVKVNWTPLPVMPLEVNRQETTETQTTQPDYSDSPNASGGNE